MSLLFFAVKIRREDGVTFLFSKIPGEQLRSETRKRWPTYKDIRALSLNLVEGEKILIHSNMDLNIQGIMLYYNQTKI